MPQDNRVSTTARHLMSGVSLLAVGVGAMTALAGFTHTARAADMAAAGLEEVVVSARRVSENIQKTPIAVTSLSADTLKDLGISKIQGLDTVTPNLIVADAASNGMGAIVYIRGIGAISVSSYSDPPVSIYVDGVIQARPTGNAFDLPDVDHIEVLRGPQGTLFGRNTTGGAVTIYTKKPTEEFGGSAAFSYGNYNEMSSTLVVNTGNLFDSGWRSKVTFQRHTFDGYVTTPGRARDDSFGFGRSTSGSFALSKTFNDKFTFDNRVSGEGVEAKPIYQVLVANAAVTAYFNNSQANGGNPAVIAATPQDLAYPDRRNPFDPKATAWGDTATLTYDLNEYVSLKSITGYRKLDQKQTGQLGGTEILGPVGTFTNIVPVEFDTPFDAVGQDQISEEFQATGKYGEFNYVAGLYYFHERIHENQRTVSGSVLASGLASLTDATIDYTIGSESYAVYANAGYKPMALDDKLEISAGIRYTADHKSEFATRVANGVAQGPQTAANRWNNVGWSVSVNYQATQDAMAYFRASSAYRSGGYNPSQIGAPPFDPEKAKTVEGGFKTEWFDNSLRLNGAAFKTWYDQLQVNQRNAQTATSIVVNAGQATFTGFELEGTALLGNGFEVNATLGYVDPKYQQYILKDTAGNPVNIANLPNVARFPMVSHWTYNIGGQYHSPKTAIGVLTGQVNFAYQSQHFFQPVGVVPAGLVQPTALALSANNDTHPSGTSQNLKASLSLTELPIGTSALQNVKIQFYGDNLTNHRHLLSFVDFASYATGAYNRPRSYGVRVSADF